MLSASQFAKLIGVSLEAEQNRAFPRINDCDLLIALDCFVLQGFGTQVDRCFRSRPAVREGKVFF